MSETDASLQIELGSGKRSKVKAANVLLRFAAPEPEALLAAAETIAREIDLDLAWEFAPEGEFAFAELARDYFGAKADVTQEAAALLRLFSAPHYFRRIGKGRFRKAPEEIVKAALLGIERKRLIAVQVDAWAARARRRHVPGADPRAALPNPLQARQERARIQGGRRGVAALGPGPARSAQGGARDRLAVRIPLAPLPVRGVPEGRRLRRRRRAGDPRDARAGAGRRVLDRRLGDDRDRRRALGPGAGQRARRRRHPHRGAGAGVRPRRAGRADRPRPALDRLHPGPQADDAAGGRRRRVHARRRPRRRRRLALRDDRRDDAGDAGERDAPRADQDRRQPAPRRPRGADRRRRARRRPARRRCRSPPS